MKYIVPEYYTSFSCKGGSCRHTCCHGWRITLTMEEYYRLLGIDCSSSLRRRLDTAFYPVEAPVPERFAAVNLRYDGDCPLHAEDGLCELHRQKGEHTIPSVCRMYPRLVRNGSCVCTNSCEAVLEALYKLDAPLKLVEAEYDYDTDVQSCGEINVLISSEIASLSDVSLSLKERLYRIGEQKGFAERAEKPCYDSEYKIITDMACAGEALNLYALPALEKIYPDAESKYPLMEKEFEKRFKNWEMFFTNVLINHLLFVGTDLVRSEETQYESLCQIYAMMRLTAVGVGASGGDKNAVIDALAGIFRYIEHADYASVSSRLIKHFDVNPLELLGF